MFEGARDTRLDGFERPGNAEARPERERCRSHDLRRGIVDDRTERTAPVLERGGDVERGFSQIAKAPVDAPGETGKKLMRLLEALDDQEDVQNVYSNANISEEMVAEVGKS